MGRFLVTGGTSGIGAAIADRLCNNGHVVLRTSRGGTGELLERWQKHKLPFDWAKWDVREPAPEKVLECLKDVHGVVHCAATNYLAQYGEMDMEKVAEVCSVNLVGTINLLNILAKTAPDGTIVCIVGSVAGYLPMRTSAAYNATKAAQDMLVRQAAREFGKRFSVIGVRPSYVEGTGIANHAKETTMKLRGQTAEEFDSYQLKASLVGRYARMNEVVDTIDWVLTQAPAQALTGSFLNPSCGF